LNLKTDKFFFEKKAEDPKINGMRLSNYAKVQQYCFRCIKFECKGIKLVKQRFDINSSSKEKYSLKEKMFWII
jgi:hypothetical protein